MPLALIRGGKSQLFQPDDAAYLLTLIAPGSPYVRSPEAEHHLMIDQPLAFVAALRALLAAWPAEKEIVSGLLRSLSSVDLHHFRAGLLRRPNLFFSEESVAAGVHLDLALPNNEKTGPKSARSELEEKAGAEGRLAAAAQSARRPRRWLHWGLVNRLASNRRAGQYIQRRLLNDCYDQETAAWEQEAQHRRTGKALSRIWKRTRSKIFARSSGLGSRGGTPPASNPTSSFFQGTMAGPMETWCKLDLTARQAIWMEG